MNISVLLERLENICILKNASKENLFKYLPDDALTVKDFQCGETIYSPLSENKYVGVIISGRAVAEPMGVKENALIKIFSENDVFGIANLYSKDEPFPSVIIAKSSVRVLFADGNAFRQLIENDSDALRAYLAFLSDRIVFLNKFYLQFSACLLLQF